MSRRSYKCRCCDSLNCNRCDEAPAKLIANIAYASGGGVIVDAGKAAGPPAVSWGDFETTCEPSSGTIWRVRVEEPGDGYATLPTFAISGGGGTVSEASLNMDFRVVSISVTDGGDGYADSPAVSPGVAHADVRGKIVSLKLTDPGEGYQTAPIVAFSGGTGAKAVASIDKAGRVTSLALTAEGSGYPPSPPVTLDGGEPTRPAEATATISGKVVSVEVLDPLITTRTRRLDGTETGPLLEAVSFSGDATTKATGEATYTGSVASIIVTDSKGFASPPTVTITGEADKKATAIAEITREQKHALSAALTACGATISSGSCFSSTSSNPPQAFATTLSCGEQVGWQASVSTSADNPFGGSFVDASPGSRLERMSFFPGEAIWASINRTWSSSTTTAPSLRIACNSGFSRTYGKSSNEFYARRFYSRVPPDDEWIIKIPDQSGATTPARFAATLTPYVDPKEDSLWYLESIELTEAGENLYMPEATGLITVGPANSRHTVALNAVLSRSVPEAKPAELSLFTAQPELTIEFAQDKISSHLYRVASVTIEDGGVTTADNGTAVRFPVVMDKGHEVETPILSGVIEEGQLSTLDIAEGGLVLGPASIKSIGKLLPDPGFRAVERFLTGESSNQVEISNTQPTVTAEAENAIVNKGSFTVSLESATDVGGLSYWRVASINIGSQPSSGGAVIVEPEPPAVAARPAIAYLVPDRQAPDPEGFSASLVDDESRAGPFENFVVFETVDEFDDPVWGIQSAELSAAGYEIEGFAVGHKVVAQSLTAQSCSVAEITVTAVDGNGKVTDFEITKPGQFFNYKMLNGNFVYRRVAVVDGGKYYVRQITETDQPLENAGACLGPISEETGWDRKVVDTTDPFIVSLEVGQTYNPITFGGITRTRRCGLPEISLELR